MFWGSTIDPSKAKAYVLPTNEYLLPSFEEPESTDLPTPAATKSHPKPTLGLPDDHETAEGEADRPAFPGNQQASSTASMTPTPDEGWFSDMSNLVTNSKWLFGAFGIVLVFGVGSGVFFWRRRAKRRAAYTSLAADDVAMSSMSNAARPRVRAKELYDAFGEASDDEDADEETGLRPRHTGEPSTGVGFHSGFFDDEQGEELAPRYRDEPEISPIGEHLRTEDRSDSPGSGSSWDHASQT